MTTMKAEPNDSAAGVAAQGATVAPEKAVTKKAASRKKGAPSAPKKAKGAKVRRQAKAAKKAEAQKTATLARKAATPRAESKAWTILETIGRSQGATLAEIMTATGWQAHSVRGFLSTAGKKHNVQIESTKNESGSRLYRIQA
jgi:Protein of unknown function (DUF3489)